MKAISLLQPWASLVVMGAKKIETRSWNTKYRGEILIHASKWKSKAGRELAMYNRTFYDALQTEVKDKGFEDLPFGAIIGKVNIVNTCSTDRMLFTNEVKTEGKTWQLTDNEIAFGDYSDDRFAWLLSDPVKFKKITPAKGSLSIWNFQEQICLKCGCTEDNACVSRNFGPCRWVEENLCSHCEEGVEAN